MLHIIVVILLIKCDLGRLGVHVDILEESAVHVVSLLLNGGAELEEIFGYGLVGTSENVDEPESVSMYSFAGVSGTYEPECDLSSTVKKVMASPVLPARPVRPMRWT